MIDSTQLCLASQSHLQLCSVQRQSSSRSRWIHLTFTLFWFFVNTFPLQNGMNDVFMERRAQKRKIASFKQQVLLSAPYDSWPRLEKTIATDWIETDWSKFLICCRGGKINFQLKPLCILRKGHICTHWLTALSPVFWRSALLAEQLSTWNTFLRDTTYRSDHQACFVFV